MASNSLKIIFLSSNPSNIFKSGCKDKDEAMRAMMCCSREYPVRRKGGFFQKDTSAAAGRCGGGGMKTTRGGTNRA